MRKTIMFLSMLACFMLSSCAPLSKTVSVQPAASTNPEQSAMLQNIKQLYSASSVVVIGSPMDQDEPENTEYTDIKIEHSIAGNVQEGDVLHLESVSLNMKSGESYLLFLDESDYSAVYAEDEKIFKTIGDTNLLVKGGNVFSETSDLQLSEIVDELIRLDSSFSIPAEFFYFDSLKPLTQNSDEIFIGRVVQLSQSEMYPFHAQSDGFEEQYYQKASIAEIDVLSLQKGTLATHARVPVVHSPALLKNTLNNKSLLNITYTDDETPVLKQGNVYLFFLRKAPDNKKNYFYFVNPLQGFVQISADTILPSSVNNALLGENSLSTVLSKIRYILTMEDEAEDYRPFKLN